MRRIVAYAVMALFVGTGNVAAAPLPDAVPIEVFAALPAVQDPELSPDGSKLAAKIAVGGRQLLVVQPLFGGSTAAIGDDKIDINWWSWVNDNWLVVGVGDDQIVYGEEVYVTRTLGISADMKQINSIQGGDSGIDADDVIWIARDGSPKVLLSRQTGLTIDQGWYPSVFDVDVSTGKAKRIVNDMDSVWDWDADASGNVRFGVIWRDGKKRGVVYRPPGGRFERVMLGKREEDAIPTPKIFKADGSAIAFADEDGREAVYQLALPSFTLGKKLFGNDRYDVDGMIVNQRGDDVAGIAIIENRSKVEWFDPALKDIQQSLDQTAGPGNAKIISWSRDRTKLLVRIGTASQAGSLYYWDTRGAAMQRLGWYNADLKARKLSPVKTIEYKARDGTPIEAVLTLPRSREAKKLPLIVMPHGGPGARDSEEYDWWVQFLAEQGYAVIQPNFRGSTGYGKAFEEKSEGQWGLKMQDDLLDAIDWAASEGIADPKRVCIVGASYGGYAAMRGAQRDGTRYRCAVAYAGVSDIGAMLRYDRNFLGKWVTEYWKKQVTDSKAVSPRFHAADFGTPILIAHGAVDKRVPVKQSRMLVEELKKAGKPYEYLEQKKGDHHFSRAEDRLEFLKALKALLDKHNPA